MKISKFIDFFFLSRLLCFFLDSFSLCFYFFFALFFVIRILLFVFPLLLSSFPFSYFLYVALRFTKVQQNRSLQIVNDQRGFPFSTPLPFFPPHCPLLPFSSCESSAQPGWSFYMKRFGADCTSIFKINISDTKKIDNQVLFSSETSSTLIYLSRFLSLDLKFFESILLHFHTIHFRY